MFLIAGLGNPGLKYKKNRHNAGFMAVDFLVQELLGKKTKWRKNDKAQTEFIKAKIGGQLIHFLKPQTFMNNSGLAVAYAAKKHHLQPKQIIVIYDELDLPFGKTKVRPKGSSAGHNGVKSIIEHLGTDQFWRIRIGIASPKYLEHSIPADKFVLKNFSSTELKKLKEEIFPQVTKFIDEIINNQN